MTTNDKTAAILAQAPDGRLVIKKDTEAAHKTVKVSYKFADGREDIEHTEDLSAFPQGGEISWALDIAMGEVMKLLRKEPK